MTYTVAVAGEAESRTARDVGREIGCEVGLGDVGVGDEQVIGDERSVTDERIVGERRRTLPPWASALGLYATLKLVGFGVFMYLLAYANDFRDRHPRMDAHSHVWDVLATWDGWWYQQIAEHGYDPKLVPIPGNAEHWSVEQNSAAFFPLYPALIRLVSAVSGLGTFGSGLLVSVSASFIAAAGIYATVKLVSGHRTAVCATGLWAVWPGSGIEWAVYSDALYTALAVWTCHAVLTRRWPLAGILCATAGLARPSALPLIAAVSTAALLAARRGPTRRPLLALALAPSGFLGYLTWVGVKAGNLRAFFILESNAWNHYVDYGSQTLHATRSIMTGRTDYDFANPVEDQVALATLLLALILLAALPSRRPPLVLSLYAALTLLMTMSSHQIFGDMSRYLLPAFPLLIPAAHPLARLPRPTRATIFTLTALASGSYAGYVLFELGIP
jgi:hypothetical protein